MGKSDIWNSSDSKSYDLFTCFTIPILIEKNLLICGCKFGYCSLCYTYYYSSYSDYTVTKPLKCTISAFTGCSMNI